MLVEEERVFFPTTCPWATRRIADERDELIFRRNRICLWDNKQYLVAIHGLCNQGVTLYPLR